VRIILYPTRFIFARQSCGRRCMSAELARCHAHSVTARRRFTIGMVPRDHDPRVQAGAGPDSYGVRCDGRVLSSGALAPDLGATFETGDVVGLLVLRGGGEVAFTKNGSRVGAF
jgi:hypothetical protein